MRSGLGIEGPLYLEVVPAHFAIKVRTGDSLNQIRFVRGDATVSDALPTKIAYHRPAPLPQRLPPKALPQQEFRTERGLFLRIDLTGSARQCGDRVPGKKQSRHRPGKDRALCGARLLGP